MLRGVAWVIDQESKAGKWLLGIDKWSELKIKDDASGWEKSTAFSGLMIWYAAHSPLAITPYWQMYRLQQGLSWAVKEDAIMRKWGKLHILRSPFVVDWYPKTLRFVRRGGAARLAAKFGSRMIPYAGWALFALDVVMTAQWAYDKYTEA